MAEILTRKVAKDGTTEISRIIKENNKWGEVYTIQHQSVEKEKTHEQTS